MITKFALMRALLPLCLFLTHGCSDFKKAMREDGKGQPKEGVITVEGSLSSEIEDATLPLSFDYTTASGLKIAIVTAHANVVGSSLELLSHALRPDACKVTLALTAAEAATFKIFFANEQVCLYIAGPELISCAYFVAEGHQYRVRFDGITIRLGGCTVEGYQYLCDSKAAYGASEFLRTVVIPSKAGADCVPL